jgi:hypothetical protein
VLVLLAQLNAANTGLDATASATALSRNADILGIVGRVLNVGLGLLGVITLGIILWAGWRWMTANGNSETVAKAQTMLLHAVAGLLVIFSAAALARFVILQVSVAVQGTTITGVVDEIVIEPETPTLQPASDDPWNVGGP